MCFSIYIGSSLQASNQPNFANDSHIKTANSSQPNPHNLEVGSIIQYGEPAQCGVIKWIGYLPGQTEISAGVEMVRHGESLNMAI